MERSVDLSSYDISPTTGFLNDSHRTAPLGGDFKPYEDVLSSLPRHIREKTLGREIEGLPELVISNKALNNMEEWKRAFVLLSFLGQACKVNLPDNQPEKLGKVPEKLAKPWVAVGEQLGVKPCMSYAAAILYNFQLHDESKPLNIENISACNTFTGLEDESWLYRVHMAAEIAAAPGLVAIANSYTHMDRKDYKAFSRCLEDVRAALDTMTEQILYKTLKCEQLNPYFSRHESTRSSQYLGSGSAAPISSMYAFEVFLGVQNFIEGSLYMPRKHKQFLEKLDSMPSVIQFCEDSNDDALTRNYQTALRSILRLKNNYLCNSSPGKLDSINYTCISKQEATTGGWPAHPHHDGFGRNLYTQPCHVPLLQQVHGYPFPLQQQQVIGVPYYTFLPIVPLNIVPTLIVPQLYPPHRLGQPVPQFQQQQQPTAQQLNINFIHESGQESTARKADDTAAEFTGFCQLNVRRELVTVIDEWSNLGLVLDIPHHQIKEIETNHPKNVSKCREKMVEMWFQTSSQLSWSTLCTALRDPLVNHNDIAKDIERKYKVSQ